MAICYVAENMTGDVDLWTDYQPAVNIYHDKLHHAHLGANGELWQRIQLARARPAAPALRLHCVNSHPANDEDFSPDVPKGNLFRECRS